ncbi:MAG TPA: acyl-CoA desaturase [Polyangiaceae bacterium]|nr:acyl-CoA desaturase [Polyangiaceae bacterium]
MLTNHRLTSSNTALGGELVFYSDRVGIVLIHVGTVVALLGHIDAGLIAMALASYLVRMFAITGGYHRYFSHRSFKTSRTFQFLLALLGTSATQKGPLWWAAAHRRHHKYSDTPDDMHSPKHHGFWHAHMGWWFGRKHDETAFDWVPDLARFPELKFLDRYYHVGVYAWMLLAAALRGWDGFLWGYVVSTCALMHGTFAINSLAHVYGSRRYETSDTSRNNWWLALLTLGEGWHNNHHRYMSSARQGFYWWEVDVTYYVLKALSWVGIVWDLRPPLVQRPDKAEPRRALASVADGEQPQIASP